MKPFYTLLITVSIGFFIFACISPGKNSDVYDEHEEGELTAMEVDMSAFVKNQNRFMMDIYKQISDSDNNIFFSPVSLTSALGMAYIGARGDTAEEMAEVLHIDGTRSDYTLLHQRFMEHINALDKIEGVEMLIANAVWRQKGYPFQEHYLKALEENFYAQAHEVDFVKAPAKTVDTINQWVSEKTREKITRLISEQNISSLTRLVLTNAVYFYGLWELPFNPDITRKREFILHSGEEVQAPFMHKTDDFSYMETDQLQLLELPYKEKKMGMVIILPAEEKSILEIEQQLSWEYLEELLAELSVMEVRTSIPRFTIRSQFGIRPVLENMGMKKVFQPGKADLSGMDGGYRDDLHISSVVHQAFVEVTEEGTEAAAATGITVGVTSYMPPKVFHANRPFLFFIRDLEEGSILFWGRLMNPDNS